MNAFHAYDIRGRYNVDFDKNDVYKIGYFLPKILKTDQVLVGRDARVSSQEIYEYLSKGLMHSGVTVYDIGLATTPMVYFATAKHHFDASVMITASLACSMTCARRISCVSAFFRSLISRIIPCVATPSLYFT